MKLLSFGAAILALVATLSAARGQVSAQSIYEAAKKEGRLVIWSVLDVDLQKKLQRAFNKRYPGIEVEAFKIQTGPAIERAITESRAGRAGVDIIDPTVAYLPALFERNLVEPFGWTKTFGVEPEKVLFDNRAVIIGQFDLPIGYNTNLVKPDQIRSWDDLLDPRWKGKLIVDSRGASFSILAEKWGENRMVEYLEKLAANSPIIAKGAVPTAEGLAAGEGAISVGAYAARLTLFKEQGAPVEWARVGPIPAQLVTMTPIKGGPNPNAARLWTAFWTTPDAQAIFYEDQRYGMLTGNVLSPRGEEMRKSGLEVVMESLDVEKSRRLLAKAAAGITGIK